jgi:hypothetical protein
MCQTGCTQRFAILSAFIQGALARATCGAELPAGMPLRDAAGRPKAVFLLRACWTQEGKCAPGLQQPRLLGRADCLLGIQETRLSQVPIAKTVSQTIAMFYGFGEVPYSRGSR